MSLESIAPPGSDLAKWLQQNPGTLIYEDGNQLTVPSGISIPYPWTPSPSPINAQPINLPGQTWSDIPGSSNLPSLGSFNLSDIGGWFSGIWNLFKNYIPAILVMWLLPKILAKIPFIRRFKRWIPLIIGFLLLNSSNSQTKSFANSTLGVLAMGNPSISKLAFPLAGLTGALPMITAALASAGVAFSTYRKSRTRRTYRTRYYLPRRNYRVSRRY